MIPTTLPAKPLLWGLGATLVLGGAAGIAAWLSPRPQPEIRTERTAETRERTESASSAEMVETVRQLLAQNATLTAQLQANTRQQQDTATRTVERIERYVPGPSAAPATPVVVVGGQPQPVNGVTGPQLAEVITRTIEAVDKSRTETDTKAETVAKVETKTETDATKTETRAESAATDTERKTSEKVTVKPVDLPELPRFGAGYTSARQPFVSYDVTRGPKLLGLDRVGVGVFATKASGGGIDGGPQASLSLSKGKRLEPFAMIGYQVREKTPILGVGVKF